MLTIFILGLIMFWVHDKFGNGSTIQMDQADPTIP